MFEVEPWSGRLVGPGSAQLSYNPEAQAVPVPSGHSNPPPSHEKHGGKNKVPANGKAMPAAPIAAGSMPSTKLWDPAQMAAIKYALWCNASPVHYSIPSVCPCTSVGDAVFNDITYVVNAFLRLQGPV